MNNELERFKEYKQKYIFTFKNIIEINNIMYCDDEILMDENSLIISEGNSWINVGYKLKGSYSNVLSNLFPYEINFRGKTLNSIESFFQGIKFKDPNFQNLVFNYSGVDSNNIKIVNDYDWKETGILYWQGEEINRNSKEYDDLIDELYVSAIQNPLYRSALKKCNKYILHSIGETEKSNTVFTRYEFEFMLNCLKDFLK